MRVRPVRHSFRDEERLYRRVAKRAPTKTATKAGALARAPLVGAGVTPVVGALGEFLLVKEVVRLWLVPGRGTMVELLPQVGGWLC
jgi:hypothetical protein